MRSDRMGAFGSVWECLGAHGSVWERIGAFARLGRLVSMISYGMVWYVCSIITKNKHSEGSKSGALPSYIDNLVLTDALRIREFYVTCFIRWLDSFCQSSLPASFGVF